MRGLPLVLAALLVTSCGGGDGQDPSDPWARATQISTAQEQATVTHRLAEITAEAIAPAVSPGPTASPDLVRCGGEATTGDEVRHTTSVTRQIPIGDRDPAGLLSSTRTFWRNNGVEGLRNPEVDESVSQLFGEIGQLELSLTIFTDRSLVQLEVSGACLPSDAETTPTPTG